MIARYMPGIGPPWLLTIGQWDVFLDRITELLGEEQPRSGNEGLAADLARRKRQAARRRVWMETRQHERHP